MKRKKLSIGRYQVEVTIRQVFDVSEDNWQTEDELLADCRRTGEMVDWECDRIR